MNVEKVTNDTYLKVFDGSLFETTIKPGNKDALTSSAVLNLEHENFNFSGGITGYEKLSGKSSDRYQYILPYYDFDTVFEEKFLDGSISFRALQRNTRDGGVLGNSTTTVARALSHTYEHEPLGVSILNHVYSVAIDGRGGYGLSGFTFASGGNTYLTPYSITNRIATSPLSSNSRNVWKSITERFSCFGIW